MTKILVFLPDGVSRAIDLRVTRLHIGRHPRNTIALPDPLVSGVHALLRETPTGWWIEDLGSTNGTWINGKRTNSSILLAEDVLRIGGCTLRLLPSAGKSGRRAIDPGADRLHDAVTIPSDFWPTDLLRP